jgi:hypothetical protein
MFILVYVDDIMVAASTSNVVASLLKKSSHVFALKDMGELHYFLDIEVTKVNDGIVLTQEKYVNDLIKRLSMGNCK